MNSPGNVIPAKACPACASAAGTGELVEGGGNPRGETLSPCGVFLDSRSRSLALTLARNDGLP